jgi:hypothetical protein
VYFVKIVILVLAGVIVLVNDWENDKRVAFCGDKRLKSNQKALAWKRSFKVMFQPVKQTGIFVNGVLRRDDEKCFAIVHRLPPGSLRPIGFGRQWVILVTSQKSIEVHTILSPLHGISAVAACCSIGARGNHWDQHFFIPEQKNM